MTHEDEGHYRAKHPAGTSFDPEVADAVRRRAREGRITCEAAFEVVEAMKVSPSEVGKTADLLEHRITRCQLGLFGYSPDKKIVTAAGRVSDDLRVRLQEAAGPEGVSCASCWRVADSLSLEKMAVSAACETLHLKVTRCQLGAF
jgi:hypothetical protein